MKPGFFNRERSRTAHVQLDTRKCKACWKCQEKCSNNVFGKINLPWHKHAIIDNGDKCTGCLKCVKVCDYEALIKIKK